jgi:toxin ParE1/3/4
MDYKIIWTEPAISDLKDAVDYIARYNSSAALRVGNELLLAVEVLATFPRIGPSYPRGEQGNIREIISEKYRIFYQIFPEKKTVEILCVWHGSRDEPNL